MELVTETFFLRGPREVWVASSPVALSRTLFLIQAESEPIRLRFGWKVVVEGRDGFFWVRTQWIFPSQPQALLGAPFQGVSFYPAVQFHPGRIPSPEGQLTVSFWRD